MNNEKVLFIPFFQLAIIVLDCSRKGYSQKLFAHLNLRRLRQTVKNKFDPHIVRVEFG